MTNKKKIKARSMAKKTGMSYAEAVNVLNKNKLQDDKVQEAISNLEKFLKVYDLIDGKNKYLEVEKIIDDALKQNKNTFSHESPTSLGKVLVEAKVQIDRRDCVTNYLFLNSYHKDDFVKQSRLGILGQVSNDRYYLWGAEVIFSDFVPINTVVAHENEMSDMVSRCTAPAIVNEVDENIVNEIMWADSLVCINETILKKIFGSDRFVTCSDEEMKSGLRGTIGNTKVYFSKLSSGIEKFKNFEINKFNIDKFENDKLDNIDLLKRINKIFYDGYHGVCMNINAFTSLLNIPALNRRLELVSQREVLQLGLYAYYKYNGENKKIVVSKYPDPDSDELIGLPENVVNNLGIDTLLDFFEQRERSRGSFSEKFKELYLNRKKSIARNKAYAYQKVDNFSIFSANLVGKFIALKVHEDGSEERYEFDYPLKFPLEI